MGMESAMQRPVRESWDSFWQWAREHPFAVTTAALVLVAALALPLTRQGSTQSTPPADVGSDETPLFI